MDLYKDLLEFLNALKLYKEFLTNPDSKLLEDKRKNELLAAFPFIQDALPKKSKEEVKEEVREGLVRKSGRLSQHISKLTKTQQIEKLGRVYDIWSTGLATNPSAPINFDALNACIDVTNKAIGILEAEGESWGIETIETEKPQKTKAAPPKAFIAHGGDSPALRNLKNFLEALGVQPLVVEEQPSENRSVGDNVDYYARQADFAIILATKGDIDGQTGGFIPRGNVLIEIGKSQEIFKDRIIYLLQAGAKFPTNISEKVRGRFTTERMDDVFIKIARELTEMKILKAVKPQTEEQT